MNDNPVAIVLSVVFAIIILVIVACLVCTLFKGKDD